MNDPYLIKMWADAICSVLGDLLLLVLVAGIIAFIVYGIVYGIKNS